VAGTLQAPIDERPTGLGDPTAQAPWRRPAAPLVGLGLAGLLAFVAIWNQPLGVGVVGLLMVAALAALVRERSVTSLESERRVEAEHVARILQGLSRSASADEIAAAITADLGRVTGADHTVVVRHRAEDDALDATLAGTRPSDPSTTTRLPVSDLDPADDLGTAVTDRLEARVRSEFALTNTIAAPLRTARGVTGVIVLARRTDEPWSEAARRILAAAALEAAAALDRVESHRLAETNASTDALTGLPNRRYFDEFSSLLAGRRRMNDGVGILMIDIDHFKRINDRFGHDAGDEVLRSVATAIAGAVREGDVPARFGGEEFVILLRDPSTAVALEVAERVRHAVAALDLRAVGPAAQTVSVGVAVQVDPDEPIEDLLAAADRALYRAKRAGRDRVVAA
jgi:diguanylate cyclase (GGDEF)-like protein